MHFLKPKVIGIYISTMLSRCVLRTAQQHLEIPIRNYSEMNRQGTSWVARVAMRAFILLPGEPLLFKSRLRFCPGKCHGVSCSF